MITIEQVEACHAICGYLDVVRIRLSLDLQLHDYFSAPKHSSTIIPNPDKRHIMNGIFILRFAVDFGSHLSDISL